MENIKNHIKNVIKHRKSILEDEMDENDRGIIIFKYMRPFIIKLFFHLILIFLSIRAYFNFLDSSSAYDTFKQTLNKKVVLDIKIQDYSQECQEGYSNIDSTYFPKILNGCRCMNLILPANICENLKENNFTSIQAQNSKLTCAKIDKSFDSMNAPSGSRPKRNLIDLRNVELDENFEFKGI